MRFKVIACGVLKCHCRLLELVRMYVKFKNHLFVNCHCEMYKVTTHALKCIDKAGGIDNYLLSTQRADVDSIVGEKAKQLVLQALKEKEMASTTVLNGSS